MQNNKQKQDEMTQEESRTTVVNYFGAGFFKDDLLEQSLTDHFQKS